MGTILDRAVVIKKEAAYGTYVAADRAVEFLDGDTTFEDAPTIVQGQGVRAAAMLADGSRSVVVRQDATGSLGFECLPKGQGVIWEWLLGACSSTLVSTGVYQQVATMAPAQLSATIQEQWYYIADDGTYTAIPFSWLGCMATDFEVTLGSEIATVKANINGRKVDVGQTAVAVTLPSTATAPFHRGNLTVKVGTLTLATTTVLASATTALTGVEQIVLSFTKNLNTDRPGTAGLKGKPVGGLWDVSVKFTVEHRDNSWELAKAAQTAMSLLADYSGLALTSGTEELQFAIADMRVQKVTKKVDSAVPKLDIECKVMNAATPVQVVTRTSDVAL